MRRSPGAFGSESISPRRAGYRRCAPPSSHYRSRAHYLLEPWIVSQGIEIRVVLCPLACLLAVHPGRALERLQCTVAVSGQSTEAGEVEVGRGRLGVLVHVLLDVRDRCL